MVKKSIHPADPLFDTLVAELLDDIQDRLNNLEEYVYNKELPQYEKE